ncbi:MAG TPA: glycosyltransferase family 1 protein [Opitutaceae bacterium]|nr:glycosyltransferase family 1 protein [Opitutaceae bacterium]
MTLAFDARFLAPGAVHPHSRLVHIFLRQNQRTPYPAQILLYTDAKERLRASRNYAADNVVVKPLGPSGGRLHRLLWLNFSLPRALQRDRVAVFYSSFYFLPPRRTGIRLINTIHDCCVFYIPPKLNRGLLSSPLYLRVLKQTMRRTNRRAHSTVTVSHFSKAMLHQHLGIPLSKIKVCYHGLELDEPVDRGPAAAPNGAGSGPDQYFLFVGSNLPKKNIRQCIAGFARLPADLRRRCKLRLKTGCYPEDRAQIEQLGLGDRVEFVEKHMDERAMADLFKGASLLLLLSYDEGFGLPIIEAFAADVPVLVSNRAACNELVALSECKADPDDTDEIAAKWLRLATDGKLRERCLVAQRRALPQFFCRTAADAFYAAITAEA